MAYESKQVKCPYYRDETKNTIRCEGVFSPAISNNFESSNAKREYEKNICDEKYTDCELFKAIGKKYDS